MSYTQTCPRCARIFTGEDPDNVADDAVEHARIEHGHTVTREHVLSHLEVDNPKQ